MAAPPPYPGNEKGGVMPPPNPAYPQQGGSPYPQQQQQQQYGMQPAQYNAPGQQATTVVVTQPAYQVVQHFRESPVRIKCQFCQADVVTSTYYETGTLTWVACFVIAIVGSGDKPCMSSVELHPYPSEAPPPDYSQETLPSAPPMGGYPAPPPQQGYPQGGYPQQGYPQQGYQQQGYPQQQMRPQAGATVVVTTQPTVVVQRFRESPVHVQCPYCHADIITATAYETGTFAWLMCALMCIFGLDAGCCLIPFCCDSCKDVSHSCPNCRQVIQRYSRM